MMPRWLKWSLVVAGIAISLRLVLYRVGRTKWTIATHINNTYDYIVVGAGSAGAVVASRLSEDKNKRVLLLEAGSSDIDGFMYDIPLVTLLNQKTEGDWAYTTLPQESACLSMKDKKCAWPRGKLLGGSSKLNYMMYVRGSRHDYDRWSANGCDGWSYKDVLPYFLKSEDIDDIEYTKRGFHKQGGNLHVSTKVVHTDMVNSFINAAEELGLKSKDLNEGGDHEGVARNQANVFEGSRWGTDKAFLRPAMDRDNLHIVDEAHVAKVIVKDKRAIGVEFYRHGEKRYVAANREVILSAGAIGSPHILLLSGIGPAEDLTKLNIPVIADLPVGRSLQDHVAIFNKFYLRNTSTTYINAKWQEVKSIIEYITYKSGPFSMPGAGQGNLFYKTKKELKSGDIQVILLVPPNIDPWEDSHFFNYDEQVAEDIERGLERTRYGSTYIVLVTVMLKPHGTGTITLKSTDPFVYPDINPHYLADERDLKTFTAGIKFTYDLTHTGVFTKLGVEPIIERLQSCAHHEIGTDQYWECYVKQLASTLYHPTSTCKMGGAKDTTAVVDPRLRVIGIAGLRVVDASVMPDVIAGNTHAPSIMIGEKAADMIKQDNK